LIVPANSCIAVFSIKTKYVFLYALS